MKIKSILFAGLVAIAFSSCDKIAGPGGTSSITGTVSGINESYGQYETIEITVTPGSILEHGDYFIVNQLRFGSNCKCWKRFQRHNQWGHCNTYSN